MESFGRNQSHYWPASLCRSALYTEREKIGGPRQSIFRAKGERGRCETDDDDGRESEGFPRIIHRGGRIYIYTLFADGMSGNQITLPCHDTRHFSTTSRLNERQLCLN